MSTHDYDQRCDCDACYAENLQRIAMSEGRMPDELEEAIRRVEVSQAVIELARGIAASGKRKTAEEWVRALQHLHAIQKRIVGES